MTPKVSRSAPSKNLPIKDQGSPCENPFCSCDPCQCLPGACQCGVSRLSGLERKVMACVWSPPLEEVTVRDVATELPDYAYTTIATILDRLVDKEVLRRRLAKNTKYYTAIGSSSAHTAVLMHEALAADADQSSALRRFVSGLDPQQLEDLRDALGDKPE
jgi:predicted transcriptional regulator